MTSINDNIIENVRFSDVSTYLRYYSEKNVEFGGQRGTYSHREIIIWRESLKLSWDIGPSDGEVILSTS